MSKADFTVESEMGVTHRELLQNLPAAVHPFVLKQSGDRRYKIRRAKQTVMLTMSPQTERAIAAIRLPVTQVKLEFFGFTAAEHDRFMTRYKRYLHKGGG